MKQSIMIPLLVCCLALPFTSSAQPIPPPDLEALLQGKTRFTDIVQTVSSYYNTAKARLAPGDSLMRQTINRQLKKWQRWIIYNQVRLEPDGTPGNAALRSQQALELEQREAAPQPQDILSASANWQPIGPANFSTTAGWNGGMGRVNCVAAHPSNVNIFYAGTANGGLWRRDAVGAWLPLTDGLPAASIGGVVVNYNNPNQLFILTGDGEGSTVGNAGVASSGVFISNNGGFSWIAAGAFPGIGDTYYGYKLMQDPANPAVFFAGTTDGLYRSTDYCATWVRATGTICSVVTDIEFKPGNSNMMYAAGRGGCTNRFYRSTDNGQTWAAVANAGINAAQRIAIGVSANQPDKVYVLTGPATGVGTYNGLYTSTNSGQSFTLVNSTPNILGYDQTGQDNNHQTLYDLAIEVDPADANNVLVGGIDCWGSGNGGSSFGKLTHWDSRGVGISPFFLRYVHADIHNLTYVGNRLFVCTDGGVSFSDNNGLSWTNTWSGMQILQPYHIAGIEADINHIAMGAQDNGTMYRRGNSFFSEHIAGGDGYSEAIDPTNVSNMWLSVNSGIYRTINAGAAITSVTPPGVGSAFPNLVTNINNHQEVLAGYENGIFKYNSSSFIWSNRGAAGNTALISCPSNSNRFYAAGSSGGAAGRLYRSENAGDSWTDLSTKPGFPAIPMGTAISDIAVSPANSAFVYMTVGGFTTNMKVYRSTDAGENWTNISGSLPNVATLSIAIDNSGGIYVGNDLGVYYNRGTGTAWLPFYNGLPKSPVCDLLVNLANNRIRAATFGRGVWESDLYSPCGGTLALSGSIVGNYYYEAGSNISSTQQVSGGRRTEVFYRSGGNINLQPGMRVLDTMSRFKAYIGPCAPGIPIFRQMLGDSTIYYLEELDTYKHPPLRQQAYYTVSARDVQLYLPQVGELEMLSKHNSAWQSLLPKSSFAPGLYRLHGMAAIAGSLAVTLNGQKVELLNR